MPLGDLRSVKQLAAELPPFTEAALRWLIFNAPANGLGPALVRVGDRVLIDRAAFEKWVFSHRQASDAVPQALAARPAARSATARGQRRQ
jgi:hypothetical protein